MQNRANKKLSKKQKLFLPPRVSIIIGLGWFTVLIFLLVHAEKSSVVNSLYFQIPLFYVGSLFVSYGIIRSSKKVPDETNNSQRNRILIFAFGITLASFVIYSWLYLFVNGLY